MAAKTITKAQRLQLIGLLALAQRHMNLVEQINAAAREITGEEEDSSHTDDAVFDSGRRDADALLGRLKIKVR